MSREVQEQSASYSLADLKPALEKSSSNNALLDSLPIWLSAQTAKSVGRGRSPDNTHEYGVQKLRELILELAVRGKLVEQDQSDEPASVLIEKIAVEKIRLVKEGKIKKQKNLPDVAADEVSYSLPSSWVWTRLGQITQINPRNETADDTTVAFIPMPLVSTTHTGKHGQEIKTWKDIKKGYTHFADGDVAVAKITPCFENGKAAYFQSLENGVGAGTTELHVARPYGETINPRYLLVYLKAPQFLLVGETKMTGTAGQKRLPKEFFAENPLPLPPLAEQHRIIKKVDELMALCDKLEQRQADAVQAHDTLVKVLLDTLTQSDNADDFQQNWRRVAEHFDTLFTTESSIDQLKQTLLQLAVMGKLVPQDPNDEPASVLLEKIAEEKALLVKAGKMNKQKAIPDIAEEEKPFYLPDGWSWARFGNVFTLEYGDNLPKPKRTNSGEYPVYGSNGIVGTHNTYSVGEPCIVIGRKGSAGALNLCEHEGCWVTDVAYSSAPPNGINLHFAFRLFHTLGLDNLGKGIKPGLNRNEAYLVPVALPPLAEQHRIVKKVDQLMALCDQLKDRINKAQTLEQQLADAVVAEAVG